MTQQQEQMSENQAMTVGQRLQFVLGKLGARQAELQAVLPPDITFARFHATINQALRNNMDLLDCTSHSLINACVKSAYDGLRVDGKEAALVSHSVKVKTRGQPDRWEKQAQYFPMVYGLIQQILRSKTVLGIDADIIYANEFHRIIRGTNPSVEHEPMIEGDRGPMIAAYCVATFANGYKSTLTMRKDEIEDVRMASKSGNKDGEPSGVWARWPSEMWKKTVIRRHRKTLPIDRDIVIRDMEATDDFPDMAGDTVGASQLSDQRGQSTARPTRQAIADQQGTGSGMPLDLGGGFDGQTGEIIEGNRADDREQQQDQQRDVQQDQDGRAEGQREGDLPANQIPVGDEWRGWAEDVENDIAESKDGAELDMAWAAAKPILAHASKDMRDHLTALLTDRTADLAADAAAGAGADGQD
jgi:recombination protein RecT